MSKKNIKLDGYAWIAENGAIDYGFWFGDSDEPVQFSDLCKMNSKFFTLDNLQSYSIKSIVWEIGVSGSYFSLNSFVIELISKISLWEVLPFIIMKFLQSTTEKIDSSAFGILVSR